MIPSTPGNTSGAPDPETLLLRLSDAEMVRRAIEDLPPEYREAIVLRELEGLSYREIAEVAGAPIGTVMSRLARGRKRLQQALEGALEMGSEHGLR